MPGDVIGGVRSEKNGSAFEIVVIAESPQRDFLQEIFLVSFYHDLGHVRGKPARSNRVYLNIMDAPFAGQVFGESNHAAFAGVVADSLKFGRSSMDAGDRGNIDDFSAALGSHELSGGLRKKKSAGQICLDHFVPMFKAHLFDGCAPRSASVVDENIDPSELRHRRVDNRLNVGGIFDVATQCQ